MSDGAVRYPTLAAAFAASFGVSLCGGLSKVMEAEETADHFIKAIRASHWGDAVPPPSRSLGMDMRAAG